MQSAFICIGGKFELTAYVKDDCMCSQFKFPANADANALHDDPVLAYLASLSFVK